MELLRSGTIGPICYCFFGLNNKTYILIILSHLRIFLYHLNSIIITTLPKGPMKCAWIVCRTRHSSRGWIFCTCSAHGSQAYLFSQLQWNLCSAFLQLHLKMKLLLKGKWEREDFMLEHHLAVILYSLHLRKTVEALFCNHTL